MADFISYDGFIGSVLVVAVGWWSGVYIGVGGHPLVFVVIIFIISYVCYSRYCCCLQYCYSALMTFIVLPFKYRDRF